MPREITDKLDRALAPDRAAKRAAWEALKRECPEFIDSIREIAGRFGISGVACAGAVWGDVDREDREWAR